MEMVHVIGLLIILLAVALVALAMALLEVLRLRRHVGYLKQLLEGVDGVAHQSIAAARDFCRLLGDSERLLWKSEVAWQGVPENIKTGVHDGRGFHELSPSVEAAKCKHLRESISSYINKYSDVVGQNQKVGATEDE